jgi:aminoglycoside phosphotransferase (APT) family kinase protein
MAIPDLKAWGIPTMEEYVALYCQHTGRKGLPELNYYFSYNAFRLAAYKTAKENGMSPQQAAVLANAPDAREGFFAVPKVVE